MSQLHCIVVTPEHTALETDAEFIAVPLYDGELGIAPGHASLISRLGCGELRVRQGGKSERYYIDGGFVEVHANVVSVITGHAEPAASVDDAAATKELAAAMRLPTASDEQLAARERQIAQARARRRLARKLQDAPFKGRH